MNVYKKIWNTHLFIEKIILITSSIFIVAGLGATIVLRYFLGINLFGLMEIIGVISPWLYFIGASYAANTKTHVKTDIIGIYVKNKKIQAWIQSIIILITIVLSAIMTFWGMQLVIWSYTSNVFTSVWHISKSIPYGAMAIGFLLMTIYYFRDFLAHIAHMKKSL
ncbi:TRAP transporter small permease [Virgibacillus sp. W0181]|uniref:TRAP transporter small permease n=1 Tax=Virgibacillus sp. W0181 TaxID=3391581 RepID=UPI003F45E90F